MKKRLLGLICAMALAVGFAGQASALTFGSIPGGATNDGLVPVYGSSPRSGWYGADLYLLGGPADILVEYFGAEAGYDNSFLWNGSTEFSTGGNTNNFSGAALVSTTILSVASGLLPFSFLVNSGADSVANGSNPDDSGGAVVGPNFFVTFLNDPTATFGQIVDLWLDDGGAGPDDNHDDMMIRLSITNGSINVVPLPAPLVLLLSALAGLGFLGTRRGRPQTA